MDEFKVGVLAEMSEESILNAMEEVSKPENQLIFRAEAKKARSVWNWQKEEKNLILLYDRLFGHQGFDGK
jgi:hypothetical protein